MYNVLWWKVLITKHSFSLLKPENIHGVQTTIEAKKFLDLEESYTLLAHDSFCIYNRLRI